jgi:proton glutamate symport protein
MKGKSVFLAIAGITLSAVLSVVSHYFTPLPANFLLTVRWISIATLVLYALYKRTLTTWILVAMVIGAALGHDWPPVAVRLRLLSMIFLRLIRTIIAPLLFATLVSGIAAHSDLKKVGRMGLKAIVYFEAVTTLALCIGLAAINLSKAGAGVHLPPPSGEALQVQRLSAAETILHIFPENVAKSVSEGQILQVVVFSILFGIALAMVREERRRPLLNLAESLA